MCDLTVKTRSQDGMWVITLVGELTSQDRETIYGTVPWLSPDIVTQTVAFDMSGLSYINSAGIALLIRFAREAQQRGYELFAYGVSTHYQKVFRIVGLTGYIELFADEYGALETFRRRRVHAREQSE